MMEVNGLIQTTILPERKYPSEFTKDEKRALRKRAKFFVAKGTSLYYVGGGKQLNFSLLCIDLFRKCMMT